MRIGDFRPCSPERVRVGSISAAPSESGLCPPREGLILPREERGLISQTAAGNQVKSQGVSPDGFSEEIDILVGVLQRDTLLVSPRFFAVPKLSADKKKRWIRLSQQGGRDARGTAVVFTDLGSVDDNSLLSCVVAHREH